MLWMGLCSLRAQPLAECPIPPESEGRCGVGNRGTKGGSLPQEVGHREDGGCCQGDAGEQAGGGRTVERCGHVDGGCMAGWRVQAWMVRGGRRGGLREVGGQGPQGPSCSPVGEAVGGRHYPAGVDQTPSTEAVPDVDGSQPGVGAGQRGRAPDDARPEEASLLVPPATGLATGWGGLGHSQQAQGG